jgi:hypothetical protein
MTTLRQAVLEYLQMRRHLGFKLHEPGKGLLDFVRFLEQRRAPVITQTLALTWAQLPVHAQPAHWARRLSFVRGFARYHRATDPRTEIPAPGLLPFQPQREGLKYRDQGKNSTRGDDIFVGHSFLRLFVTHNGSAFSCRASLTRVERQRRRRRRGRCNTRARSAATPCWPAASP